jgi:Ni/Co efflux regulator RcnB
MKKAIAIVLAGATLLSGTTAFAQRPYGDRDRDGIPNRYDNHNNRAYRDRDRDGVPNRYDRYNNRTHRWHYYGGRYGYDGYRGPWRTGQRFNHYRDRSYWITDYRAYGLPAPRPGYRYYRDDNGDIVMAAIASGIIGLIVGNALAH